MNRSDLTIDRIYQMNCLDGMPLLPDHSIDLILSDLPYGKTKNRWDVIIDLDRLWAEYKRLIRPRGAVVLTAQCPFDKLLGQSNREWLRYEWIWEKSQATGFFHARYRPLSSHENVLVFYRQPPCYNPQFTPGKPYTLHRPPHLVQNYGRHFPGATTHNSGFRYPRSVLRIASEAHPLHPTQKPVALFEYLIRTYTDPGDLVLDNCMGSGTTAVACLNGFELDSEYFHLAQERIRRHRAQLPCL